MRIEEQTGQGGFTIIEVSLASVITLVGLVCLAGLFTLSISQNRIVKQYTSTTSFAQEKLEQLTALEQSDVRLTVGGSLTVATNVAVVAVPPTILYSDDIYVSDDAKDADVGTVYTTGTIPVGRSAQYRRFWIVQLIPTVPELVNNSIRIGVRVVALQSGRNKSGTVANSGAEETTLTTVRTW